MVIIFIRFINDVFTESTHTQKMDSQNFEHAKSDRLV